MLRLPVALSLALAVLAAGSLHAQTLPSDGMQKLDEQWNKNREVRDQFKALSTGQQTYSKEHANVVDLAAKWYTYRTTWIKHQTTPADMEKLYKELRNEVEAAAKLTGGGEAFFRAFCQQLVVRLKEVLTNDKAIARVTGARMLAALGEFGYEEAADACVEVLADANQNDGVKFWALRGLHRLFTLTQPPKNFAFKDKQRESKAIGALIQFIDRDPKFPANASREEVEGFRYLRREAIRGLAVTRHPGFEVAGKIEQRTAQTLLRVLTSNLPLAPRLDEQVEAAVGACRLKSGLTKGYQLDYAAAWVGWFLPKFAEFYQARNDPNHPYRSQPYRVHAARLGEALEALRADARENKEAKESLPYVNELVTKASSVLRAIETGGDPGAAVQNLSEWVRNTPFKGTMVYQGLPDSAIKLPEAAETQPQKPAEGDKK